MDYYHKTRPAIRLREYGRLVQEMVARLRTTESRELRNRLARETVRVMAIVAPDPQGGGEDYQRKLWDHLYQLAGPGLEIDAPFPPPPPDEDNAPKTRLPYLRQSARFHQYGRNVEALVRHAVAMPEGPDRDAFVLHIANTMKMLLFFYERTLTSDGVIFNHLRELSKGAIDLRLDQVQLKTGFQHYRLPQDARRQPQPAPQHRGPVSTQPARSLAAQQQLQQNRKRKHNKKKRGNAYY